MLSPVPLLVTTHYTAPGTQAEAEMESVTATLAFLLCGFLMAGANMDLIQVSPVMHGIKGERLCLPVETHFRLEGVHFQGTWYQTSPKKLHLVTFSSDAVISDMMLKDTFVFSRNISLCFTQLDEDTEGDYELNVNIIFPEQNPTKSVTITKTVMVTVNEPLSTLIVKRSSEVTLVEDRDNITLTCTVETGTKAMYQWLKNNRTVSPSESRFFSKNNGTLFINPVKKDDIGLYSCVARNPISHLRSTFMDVRVFYGPYNLEVNTDQGMRIGEVFTVNQGDLVYFYCLADSNPPNTCVWISRSGNNTEVLMTGPRFEVPSDKLAQPTNFLCRAFNNVTKKQDEAQFTLVVTDHGRDLLSGREKHMQGASAISLSAAIVISSILIIICMLFVFLKKTCHPKKALMKIYTRPVPEQKGLHRSGHEDATEDFGIYEFVSIPGRMESAQASCRSLVHLDSVRDLHTTIYDVIRHVPETPTLSLLK